MSMFDIDIDLTSAGGVVSVGVSVLLQVWVGGPSRVDVTIMLMGVLEATRVSLIDSQLPCCGPLISLQR